MQSSKSNLLKLFLAPILSINLIFSLPIPAVASPAPDDGRNLGLRFIGEAATPIPGANGIFLQNDGYTLVPCGIPTNGCNFDYSLEIDGQLDQVADQVGASNQYIYDSWPAIDASNTNDTFCWTTAGASPGDPRVQQISSGPLTNFNCFNENSFGQMFTPSVSGTLTEFTFAVTCLSPSSSLQVTALLFEVDTSSSFPVLIGEPIARSAQSLGGCRSTWSGHTFSNTDFTTVSINFGAPSVSSSIAYAVLFIGEGITGVVPQGEDLVSQQIPTNPFVANGFRADELGSIYFAPGSSKLSTKAKREIKSIIESSPAGIYKVTGYVQKSKSTKNNSKLSVARARAVENYMLSLGASVNFTVVIETGELSGKESKSHRARRATLFAMTPVVL